MMINNQKCQFVVGQTPCKVLYFFYGKFGLQIFFICYVSDDMALSLIYYLRLGRDDIIMLFNSYESDELAEFWKLL